MKPLNVLAGRMEKVIKNSDSTSTLDAVFRSLCATGGYGQQERQVNASWPGGGFREFVTAEIVAAAESVVRRFKLTESPLFN